LTVDIRQIARRRPMPGCRSGNRELRTARSAPARASGGTTLTVRFRAPVAPVDTYARVYAEPEGHVLAHAAMDVETGQIGVPTPTAELGALEAYPGPLALSPCYIGGPGLWACRRDRQCGSGSAWLGG
jgi:hypothetical protein